MSDSTTQDDTHPQIPGLLPESAKAPAKKAAKKTAKKAVKKTTKKTAKKAAKKTTRKTAKKAAKKTAPPAANTDQEPETNTPDTGTAARPRMRRVKGLGPVKRNTTAEASEKFHPVQKRRLRPPGLHPQTRPAPRRLDSRHQPGRTTRPPTHGNQNRQRTRPRRRLQAPPLRGTQSR